MAGAVSRWVASAAAVLLIASACGADPVEVERAARLSPETTDDAADADSSVPETDRPDISETGPATSGSEATESSPEASDGSSTATADRRPPELGGIDDLFPDLGSPDVDVQSYDVRLDLTEPGRGIEGEVEVTAAVPLDVDALALDAVGLDILAAEVDGEPVATEQTSTDLTVELPVERDEVVTAVLRYEANPTPVTSETGLPTGWFSGGDGSFVLNQPDGARTWLPSNDHPSDKADWRFEILAPADVVVSANGTLIQEGSATDPWIWEEPDPMPTYLVHLVVGDYELLEDDIELDSGTLPLTHLVPTGDADAFDDALDSVAPQIEFLEEQFGPYPLAGYGLALAETVAGLAMETQGRSLFDGDEYRGPLGEFDQLVLSHEAAHQWFGNAVTPGTWSDIWLSESFATYAQWLWLDHIDEVPLESSASRALASRQAPGPPTGDPEPSTMFGYNSYDGGAAVLHALRGVMGDDAFFGLLRQWVAEFSGTSQTTDTFIAMASDVHGEDLQPFFDEWLFAPTLPSTYPT